MSRSHRSMTTRREFSPLDRTLSSSMAGVKDFTLLRSPILLIATPSSGMGCVMWVPVSLIRYYICIPSITLYLWIANLITEFSLPLGSSDV
jgi:hypothetical protein